MHFIYRKKQIVLQEGTYFTIINCTNGGQLHTLKYCNQQFCLIIYTDYDSCLLITSVISNSIPIIYCISSIYT